MFNLATRAVVALEQIAVELSKLAVMLLRREAADHAIKRERAQRERLR